MGWGSFISDAVSSVGNAVSDAVNTVGDVGQNIINTVKDHPLEAAALAAGGYYFAPEIGAWFNPATGEAVAGTNAGAAAGATTANLSSGTGLSATGGGLGLTGGNTANLAAMGGAQGLTTIGATGGLLGSTGGTLAAGGLGAGLGLSSAATGLGTNMATGGLGALTSSQLGQLGLIQGGLGLVGGLFGGSSAADASSQAAQQYAQAAKQGADMATFRPVGTTTTFGTSNFQVDPATGQLTSAGYQLSPQLQSYQDQIMGSNRQSLTDATNLQNLGRQYIAQDPNQVASNWYNQQQALLAPSRDTESARLANNLQQTGRTGVSVAQGGGLQAANPEMAALANARAMADAQMAANAQTYGQQQVGFGQGLLNNAYQPFNAGLTTASNVEALGQQPFTLSSNLANLSSTAGARAGSLLTNGMSNSITSQQAANSYNPWATALQGAASNPLTGLGLMNAFA
jgi:putative membrane protein